MNDILNSFTLNQKGPRPSTSFCKYANNSSLNKTLLSTMICQSHYFDNESAEIKRLYFPWRTSQFSQKVRQMDQYLDHNVICAVIEVGTKKHTCNWVMTQRRWFWNTVFNINLTWRKTPNNLKGKNQEVRVVKEWEEIVWPEYPLRQLNIPSSKKFSLSPSLPFSIWPLIHLVHNLHCTANNNLCQIMSSLKTNCSFLLISPIKHGV